MKTNGQLNGHSKKNGAIKGGETQRLHQADVDRAYLAGIRECFGTLESAVSELPLEARNRFSEKLKELFDKVRAAEKRAGEGL